MAHDLDNTWIRTETNSGTYPTRTRPPEYNDWHKAVRVAGGTRYEGPHNEIVYGAAPVMVGHLRKIPGAVRRRGAARVLAGIG